MSEKDYADLKHRYLSQGCETVDIDELAEAISWATTKTLSLRRDHEMTNLRLLGLRLPSRSDQSLGVSASPVDLPDVESPQNDQQEYERYAGRFSEAGNFILWFGRIASGFMRKHPIDADGKEIKRVSLELGGKQQFGNWENTKMLDMMLRGIPGRVIEAEPEARIKIYGAPKEGGLAYAASNVEYAPEPAKSYTFIPRIDIAENSDGDDMLQINYGLLRRRKPLADIWVPGGEKVELYKESMAVAVLPMMPEVISDRLRTEYGRLILGAYYMRMLNRELPEDFFKHANTPGVRMAGSAFERGIKSGQGVTLDVLPTSAHGVMKIDKRAPEERVQLAA